MPVVTSFDGIATSVVCFGANRLYEIMELKNAQRGEKALLSAVRFSSVKHCLTKRRFVGSAAASRARAENPNMDIAFEQKIRERAYLFWMADGMGEGASERHWLSAERAVRNETETPTVAKKAAKVVARKPAKAESATAKAVKAKPVEAEAVKAKPVKGKSAVAKTVAKSRATKGWKGAAAGAVEASA